MHGAGIAHVAQYRTGLDRGELVPVAQKDQAGVPAQGAEQFGHERQGNHGRLIHDDDVVGKRVLAVVAEAARSFQVAKEPVQGEDVLRDEAAHLLFRLVQAGGDGFLQSRCGLTGGGGEGDAQGAPRAESFRLFQKECQHLHHGGGLAGARSAGDDAKPPGDGGKGGDPLPVRFSRRCGEEAGKALHETLAVELGGLAALEDRLRQFVLVAPVALQVEPVGVVQDERLELAGSPDHRRGGKALAPGRNRLEPVPGGTPLI